MDFRFPVLIETNKAKLFSICHLPSSGRAPFPVVVMCHGLGGNKCGRFRFLVRLSEMLAEQGIASVRFDVQGCGDSTGDFLNLTLDRCVEDVDSVMQWVVQQPVFDPIRYGLYGRSFGGLIAILCASRREDVKVLAVHSPLFDARPYLSGSLPSYLSFDTKKELLMFEGEPMNQAFVSQMRALDMAKTMETLTKTPFLHITCGQDRVVNSSHADQYQKVREGHLSRFVVLPDADHMCSEYMDRQTALKETTEWYISHL